MSKNNPATLAYRGDIDGLRAVAVLSVILFHIFPDTIPGGYTGVDIFFVISGYLISGHIMDGLQAARFSFGDFCARRVKRIFPALIVVLIVCMVAGWLCLFNAELTQLGRQSFFSSIFGSNILYWRESGYFDQSSDKIFLLHLWSLGIEEQFYILWPLALVLVWKIKRYRGWILGAFALMSFVANIAIANSHPTADFYLPITRFWELLAGTLLAYAKIKKIRNLDRWPEVQSLAGLLLIGTGIFALNRDDVFPGWLALLPVCGAVLMIAGGEKTSINHLVLGYAPVVAIGRISYPLYLWHWPLLVYARVLKDGPLSANTGWVVLALAFALAVLTYQFVERPIRSNTRQPFHTRAALALTALMIVVGCAGYKINEISKYLPERFAGHDATMPAGGWTVSDECRRQYPFGGDFCAMSVPGKPATAALLGDSHAEHFYPGLEKVFAKKGQNLVALGSGNCAPLYDVDTKISKRLKYCADIFNPILDSLAASKSIRTVVLSSYAISTVTGSYFGDARDFVGLSDRQNALEQSNTAVYANGLRRTIKKLQDAGKQVAVILDTPELDFNPLSCKAMRPFSFGIDRRQSCFIEREVVETRLEPVRQLTKEVLEEFPAVIMLDPLEALCDQDICRVKDNDDYLYSDNNHLSREGSRYVSERFARQLR